MLLPGFVFRMREVAVEEQNVLLVRTKGQYSAVGSRCSHYNAPLIKGKASFTFSSPISIQQYLNEELFKMFCKLSLCSLIIQERWLVRE